jgi:hypothetical protein
VRGVKPSRCARPLKGLREKFFSCLQKSPSIFCTHSLQIAANNKQEEIVMGLDMVAYTVRKASVSSEVDFTVEADSLQQLYYWRKHHRLHDWMQRLYVAKGGRNPDFNVAPLALNSADLNALETAIKAGDLWARLEPFSGHLTSKEQDDLEFIHQARVALKDGLAVFYVACF